MLDSRRCGSGVDLEVSRMAAGGLAEGSLTLGSTPLSFEFDFTFDQLRTYLVSA